MWNFSKNYEEFDIWPRNLPNESLGQAKRFNKHAFGVGVGWEFQKMGIEIKNIWASADIHWFL